MEKIAKALAEEQGLDADTVNHSYDSYGSGEVWDIDGQEWLLFADDDEAERSAVEYMVETYDTEGAEFFGKALLEQFVTCDKATAWQVGIEDAQRAYDLDDDEAIEEAGGDYEDDLDSAQDELDAFDEDGDQYDVAETAFEDTKGKIADAAREYLAEQITEDTSDAILADPMGWANEMGYDGVPEFFSTDVDAMAQYIVDNDGVGHTLGGYDGNEIEIDGAIAVRLN